MDNPFERYDLDPREGIAAITARLKELAEEARDEAERARIRAAWEELTLHPARRLRAALFAHPETREPLGTPPPLSRRNPASRGASAELELRDLAARPSVLEALGAAATDDDDVPSLEDDPVLRGLP
ncbi:MAG: hypothetical protein KF894_33550 [Labilithrix sp.]|nr:hypothetical protein [Labilithrix sp.]